VDGIFDSDLQCIPFQSPRFEESRQAADGRSECGGRRPLRRRRHGGGGVGWSR
jgi:hypothetical protein